jgi:hypothetical protein
VTLTRHDAWRASNYLQRLDSGSVRGRHVAQTPARSTPLAMLGATRLYVALHRSAVGLAEGLTARLPVPSGSRREIELARRRAKEVT